MAGYIGKAKSLAVLAEQDPSIPSQTGNSGKYLTTDGTDASWATVEALPDAIDVNASAPADSVVINSSGNVGIGDTTVNHKLVVVNGSDASDFVRFYGADTTSEFVGFGTQANYAIISGGGIGGNNTGLIFKTAPGGQETERMRIDSAGRVTMPYQPAFAAQGNGGSNGNATANYITALSSKYDIGTNFSAGVFTAPISGLYEFTFCVLYNSGTGRTRIRVNQSDYFGPVNGAGALQVRETPTGASLFATFLIQMSQNDNAQMFSEDGTYSTESSYLYFAGKLVG